MPKQTLPNRLDYDASLHLMMQKLSEIERLRTYEESSIERFEILNITHIAKRIEKKWNDFENKNLSVCSGVFKENDKVQEVDTTMQFPCADTLEICKVPDSRSFLEIASFDGRHRFQGNLLCYF